MARLTAFPNTAMPFKNVDIVIEAVFEDIKVKHKSTKNSARSSKDDCHHCSNTSSIPITAMAKYVTTRAFGGINFFSPVWLMQLVESSRASKTSQDTIDNLLNFSAAYPETPDRLPDNRGRRERPCCPHGLETFRYLEEGNAIEKIDKACCLRYGLSPDPADGRGGQSTSL